MPKTFALAARQSITPQGWRWRAFLAFTSLAAGASLSAGVAAIVAHTRAVAPPLVLAPAALVLLVSSAAQIRAAWHVWRSGADLHTPLPFTSWHAWLQLLVGACIAYLAIAAIGPAPDLAFAWLAAVAGWFALLLMPLVAAPSVVDFWCHWMPARIRRRSERWVLVSLLLTVAAEAGLQGQRFARQHGWLADAPEHRAPMEGLDLSGALLEGSPEGTDVARLSTGPFRVAVLADELTVNDARRNGYLARVQQILPGLEIVPIALSHSWSTEPNRDLAARLSDARPDLVLAVLSACQDLAHQPPQESWFDWRHFQLARLMIDTQETLAAEREMAAASPVAGDDFEAFLGRLAPQLAACRTPIDPSMHERWRQTFAGLDRLLDSCRDQQLPVALVLVPGEFQVNRELCATLARRVGYAADQLDLDLPQRKLTGYAEQRGVSLVDLLPSLRLCRQSPYERNAAVWNDHGHTTAATALGGWLESRYGHQLSVAAQLSSAP